VAGNGNNFVFFSGDGGAATNAALRGPNGVAVDGAGNLFIADNGNNRVRKMNEACLASLALDRVSGAQAGNYAVVITDYSGSITSRLAVLNVFLRLNHFTTSVSGNVLHVDLSGESNFAYILQTATNLAPPLSWQSVYTNSADVNGDWHYTNNVGGPQCFYRVTAQ
jgi:DNA-binding beta-propeller fold protein YncE